MTGGTREGPEKSERDRDLEVAESLAHEVFGAPCDEVREIVGMGVVNRVFVARSGSDSVVVRMSVDDDQEVSLAAYRKEAWCMEQAARVGIPVPAASASGRRHGRAFLIESFIEGDSGEGVSMYVLAIWKELGYYARRLAEIEVGGFGPDLISAEEGRFGNAHAATWSDQIEYNLQALTENDPLIGLGVYEPEHRYPLRARFAEMQDQGWATALCHGDLVPGNTIVDPIGDVYLLDWGSARVDVWPESVVAGVRKLLYLGRRNPNEVGWFMDGLDLEGSRTSEFRRRVESVMLLKAFDAVRWALDQNAESLGSLVKEAGGVWHAVRFGGDPDTVLTEAAPG